MRFLVFAACLFLVGCGQPLDSDNIKPIEVIEETSGVVGETVEITEEVVEESETEVESETEEKSEEVGVGEVQKVPVIEFPGIWNGHSVTWSDSFGKTDVGVRSGPGGEPCKIIVEDGKYFAQIDDGDKELIKNIVKFGFGIDQ